MYRKVLILETLGKKIVYWTRNSLYICQGNEGDRKGCWGLVLKNGSSGIRKLVKRTDLDSML